MDSTPQTGDQSRTCNVQPMLRLSVNKVRTTGTQRLPMGKLFICWILEANEWLSASVLLRMYVPKTVCRLCHLTHLSESP